LVESPWITKLPSAALAFQPPYATQKPSQTDR
jgi:hypothetical protein